MCKLRGRPLIIWGDVEGPNDFFVPRRYKVAEGGYCIALRPSVCPTLIQYLQLWNAPSPSNPYLLCSGNQRRGTLREEPLMIWGGARAKVATRPGKKINSTTGNKQLGRKKSARWSGKKIISWLVRKKNSTRILCPSPPPPDH